jgi:HD superfamily phosphohydrolase
MQFFNHGGDGYIWEPLYRRRVALSPCEQAIIQHPALRRLQGIAHYGASAYILPMTHTRFTHTLGVFTLAAHFCPTDAKLRLAALLHDVGHIPFSHSVERALDLDHHRLTVQVITEGGLGEILERHGFDPQEILGLIEGAPANPLVNGGEGMSLDHLDSWLRDSQTCGFGEIPPHLLLDRLRLNGHVVEALDEDAAWDLVQRMTTDHALFLQPLALAMDALVGEIFRRAPLSGSEMLQLGDLQALERASALAGDLVAILRERPWTLSVRPDDGGEGVPVTVKKIYAARPYLGGRPVGEGLPEVEPLFAPLESLKRSYRVTWPE